MNNLHPTISSLLTLIVDENPVITNYLTDSSLSDKELVATLREHYKTIMVESHPNAWAYYTKEVEDELAFYKLTWREFAFIRIMDYLDHEGKSFIDRNLHEERVVSNPITLLRKLVSKEEVEVSVDFVLDMFHLLRQLNGKEEQNLPTRPTVIEWMNRHPSGLESSVIEEREENKERIIALLVEKIRSTPSDQYTLADSMSDQEAIEQVRSWWGDDKFHLRFAIRKSDELQLFLDNSIDQEQMRIMREAEKRGIPIFATPYFLSLIDTKRDSFRDEALRSYLFYTQDLVDEFGSISAWEKEDVVEIGKPNEAGWILPSHTLHRRYPSVAIFIPDTMGRACGGLCAYCQRMYDFQAGRFNFDLDALRPKKSWDEVLGDAMNYFKEDPYLEDILITGGDALMSTPASLKKILDAVLEMAHQKREENKNREEKERLSEIKRIRLGTKLLIYLPQRVTDELTSMLKEIQKRAFEVGIEQCIIQTHFSSAMEITPESKEAVKKLLQAGWAVTNQMVFTVAASRRGHSARLREALNEIGVLPYYTFTVKGFKENRELFANNPRSMQEQIEERSIGRVDVRFNSQLGSFIEHADQMVEQIQHIREADQIPFLATDRNTINLPGVGKSNTYRTIGITADGRRIMEFEFDKTRSHSPSIESMDPVVIIESKSVATYLRQLEAFGEDSGEYSSIWGYSLGRLESRSPVFKGMSK